MKIFSLKKYKQDRIACGISEEIIDTCVRLWAKKCDGLTENEMLKIGCFTQDDWMVEVEKPMNDIAKSFRANTLASVRTLCDHDSYSDGRLADQFTDDLIKTVTELQDITLVLAQVEDKVALLDAMDEDDILDYVRDVMGRTVE